MRVSMTGLEKPELKLCACCCDETTAGATVELCSAKGEASKSAIEEALTKGCKAQGSTVGKGSCVQSPRVVVAVCFASALLIGNLTVSLCSQMAIFPGLLSLITANDPARISLQ